MSYNNITRTIQTKSEWLSNNGFNVEGTTFCVIGANTFSIKEELKQLGYKFNPLLKWHSPLPTELPSGFRLIEVSFDTYYSFNEELGIACPHNDAEEKLVEFFIERRDAAFRNITVQLDIAFIASPQNLYQNEILKDTMVTQMSILLLLIMLILSG